MQANNLQQDEFYENAFCDSGNSPPTTAERFVSADDAAQFLSISRRDLLSLARKGLAGGYPLGTGEERNPCRSQRFVQC